MVRLRPSPDIRSDVSQYTFFRGDDMEDFDFITAMIAMITSIVDFLFQWIAMAAADTGRAALDNSIR